MLQAMGDAARLAALIGAAVPESWPPQGVREHQIPQQLDALTREPGELRWHGRLIVLRGNPDVLVGVVNLKGPPDGRGRVEIGYEVEPEYRRQGIATEAVRALIAWCAAQPTVKAVQARTLPSNRISAHMLSRLGFTKLGPQRDPRLGELIVWELMLR
jgi:RimJ/RimL family protein N-acetyltransferase